MRILIIIDEFGQHPPKVDDGEASGLEVLGALHLAAAQVSAALMLRQSPKYGGVMQARPTDVPQINRSK